MRVLIVALFLMTPIAAFAQVSPNLWFGTWTLRLENTAERPETLIYSDAGDGMMRMESVETGSIVITRLDGRPATDIGSGSDGTTALAVKALSPTSYSWTFYRVGAPVAQGINTLSPDRRSFQELSWRVAQPDKKVVLVYIRQ